MQRQITGQTHFDVTRSSMNLPVCELYYRGCTVSAVIRWEAGTSFGQVDQAAGRSTFKLLLGQRKLWKTAAERLLCFSRCEASKRSNIGQIWRPMSTRGAHSNIRNSQHSYTIICFSLWLELCRSLNATLDSGPQVIWMAACCFFWFVMVTDGQELSKPQLESLALVNEILLYTGPCLCSDIHKSVVDNWSSYWSTNGHIVSGRF